MPNLHMATVVIDGVKRKMKLCTKCIRKYRVAHTRLAAKRTEKKQDKKKN
jgi:ribosomal protein L28